MALGGNDVKNPLRDQRPEEYWNLVGVKRGGKKIGRICAVDNIIPVEVIEKGIVEAT